MKITFLLPTPGVVPSGGVKVIYEHANGLAMRGHDVAVVHTLATKTRDCGFFHSSFIYFGRHLGLKGGYGPYRWMKVNPKVHTLLVPSLSSRRIPRSDILVATAWMTAEAALELPADWGRKFYFVQDYEYFMTASAEIRERMATTYRAPFCNLVISPACAEMVVAAGGRVHAEVPNGLDHDRYQVEIPIDSPERRYIGFPSRHEPFKKTDDAIAAIVRFRAQNPESGFKFWTFGTHRPADLPDWIDFHKWPSDATLADLYNRSAIFIVPSLYEGWGLPGSEAMCCGAALVTTNNGGVNAYAVDGKNAIFCNPGDVEALVTAIKHLVENQMIRIELANEAVSNIAEFTWDASNSALESALLEPIK